MSRLVVLGLIGSFLGIAFLGELIAQTPNKADMPKYIATAKDPKANFSERISALHNIARLGRLKAAYAKDAVEPLIGMVKKEGNANIRAEAIRTLGAIDPEDREAVTALIDVLKDEKTDREVQAACVTALGMLGAKAKDAIPVLREIQAKANKDKKNKKFNKAVSGALKSIQSQLKR